MQSIFLHPYKIKITTNTEKELSILMLNKNEVSD